MDYLDAVLTTIGEAQDENVGRTALQKLIYFASQKEIVEDTYFPHYYGPYSEEVQRTIMSLISRNLAREELESGKVHSTWPFDFKRYIYTPTEDGKQVLRIIEEEYPSQYKELSEIIETSKKVTGLSFLVLSYAAKVHYILRRKELPMNATEIQMEAKNLGWKLTDVQMEKAVELLQRIGLAETTE